MTSKDLIQLLKTLPPNTEIILSSDEEGNSYLPLREHSFGWLVDEQFHNQDWTAEDCCQTVEEHKKMIEQPLQICLFP